MSYTVSGHGDPIVLVHGWAGSRRSWQQQAWLEARYQVWTLELPGFGESAHHQPLEITQTAEMIVTFFEKHQIKNPVFVGHSMGAHIGLHVATQTQLRGLVLVSSSALVNRSIPSLILELPRLAYLGERRFVPTVMMDGWRSGIFNLLRAAQYVINDDPHEVLPGVTCPTLLVWGDRDTWVTKEMGEALLGKLLQARLEVIPGAAHMPMVDRPQVFNGLLQNWLEQLR
jgi:pimeloyl-ACP methyl ester carboxylesterase